MRAIGWLAAGVALLLPLSGASVAQQPEAPRWVPTWHAVPNEPGWTPNQTVRTLVKITAGGSSVRVRLSNALNPRPLRVDHVTVALGNGGANGQNGSMREVRFRGAGATTIRARGAAYSDPIPLNVADHELLLVSTFVRSSTPCHARAHRTNYAAPAGDHTTDLAGAAFTATHTSVCLVGGVDVAGTEAPGTVVALGDSITEGDSTNWPGYLRTSSAVLNSGISGNCVVLHGDAMVTRLYRDALFSAQVRTVVFLGGINDIQQDVRAEAIIAAIRTIRARTQLAGVRLVIGTITPWRGWQAFNDKREAQRQLVNEFIRTAGIFDGVVDFDELLRDPADLLRLRPEFDSGDHLHPNDAAYRVMAGAVPV
ncbi:SGNH hydrolase [Lentzea sp. NBRC 105346]|uniref:GDSL-type esterase/lipase family protein n=1 Tax=Lentzea sp. NBRC 105346 TaxID=3032205 RepID=UPI0024A4675F|nr:GDSL-type esterase/lipase family protein [Lentzea sp. NBRC 105346]GLZ33083.1 SGNH hydrolase [Lentzea sp. NBRC 105346]